LHDVGKYKVASRVRVATGIFKVFIRRFCLTVGPVIRTAGILTQSVKGAGC